MGQDKNTEHSGLLSTAIGLVMIGIFVSAVFGLIQLLGSVSQRYFDMRHWSTAEAGSFALTIGVIGSIIVAWIIALADAVGRDLLRWIGCRSRSTH